MLLEHGLLAARPSEGPRGVFAVLTNAQRAWAITFVLASLNLMSYLDRHALALLVPDLKKDLDVSDLQYGMLIGPAFIVAYNLALLPAAAAIDRWNRKYFVTAGVTIWSLMTIGAGFARNFEQLLFARCGLAVGEAFLSPAAFSMIGDLFKRTDRPIPTGIFIMGSVIGNTGSALLVAVILQMANVSQAVMPLMGVATSWRLTLVFVGLLTFVILLMFITVAREPTRSGLDLAEPDSESETFLGHLRKWALVYGATFVAVALLAMNLSSLAVWGPTFFMRSFDFSQVHAGYLLGTASLIGGVLGTLVIPAITRHLLVRKKVDAMVYLAAVGVLTAGLLALTAGFSPTATVAVLGCGGVAFLTMGFAAFASNFALIYAPSHLRGRIVALLLFVTSIANMGIGPIAVPAIAAGWFSGPTAIGKAIGVVALISCTISSMLFLSIRNRLRRVEAGIR